MLKGVICGYDGTPQAFETCIDCHRNLSTERNCGVPVATLISMRDNHITRKDAGVSASTLLSCARAVALEEKYDYYESVMTGYNKFRGTLIHAMLEDNDPPEWVIEERRVERMIEIDGVPFRVSGKMDHIDTKNNFLLDYKSCPNIPRKPKIRHELQLNIYRWLLHDGVFCDTKEPAQIQIDRIGIHYVTFHTKPEKAWLKMLYPVHSMEDMDAFVERRARPIKQWQDTGELPACNDLEPNTRWPCDCEKLEAQLRELGTWED